MRKGNAFITHIQTNLKKLNYFGFYPRFSVSLHTNYHFDTMNIKFKMPKFGRTLTKGTFWKELFLTFIATTISIILTFGTAHLIEQKQKKNAGRQSAMMIIHDMDQNAEKMKNMAKQEDRAYECSKYVLEHFDKIDAISVDTLSIVLNFLLRNEGIQFNDSKEKVFHSSQDSWKNIDNANFIDLVQDFYHERQLIQKELNSDVRFIEPITREQQYELMLKVPNYDILASAGTLLKDLLKEERVKFFLLYSSARSRTYLSLADEWKMMSDKGKFIMGITDEELNQYLEMNRHSGRLIKERELIGKWENKSENGQDDVEFMKDHTFVIHNQYYIANPFYSGHIVATNTMKGTWEFVGDSLVSTYDVYLDYNIDDSQITYAPEMKDSVKSYLANNKIVAENIKKDYIKKNEKIRQSAAVYLDVTGEKIEMNFSCPDELTGATTRYMVRTK